MRGGATLVHSVDSSAKAVELTDSNINLNFPDDPRHKSFAEDAFKYLNNLHTLHQQYDLIILDPPAFAKHREALRNALKGYKRFKIPRRSSKLNRAVFYLLFLVRRLLPKSSSDWQCLAQQPKANVMSVFCINCLNRLITLLIFIIPKANI